jgi:hypothetical protein
MGWQERTEQQVGAQGVADLRRWLAMASQPEPVDLPQANGLSILITVVAVVAALLLVPVTDAAAKPLPAGIYEVAVEDASITLSVGADGATAVAAPAWVVVHLEHDDEGRPLDEFTVEVDGRGYTVDLDVAEDGSYTARIDVGERDGGLGPDDARAPGGQRAPGDERARATNRDGATTTPTDTGGPARGGITEGSGPSGGGERGPSGQQRAADPATTGREQPSAGTGRDGADQATVRDPRAPAGDEGPKHGTRRMSRRSWMTSVGVATTTCRTRAPTTGRHRTWVDRTMGSRATTADPACRPDPGSTRPTSTARTSPPSPVAADPDPRQLTCALSAQSALKV